MNRLFNKHSSELFVLRLLLFNDCFSRYLYIKFFPSQCIGNGWFEFNITIYVAVLQLGDTSYTSIISMSDWSLFRYVLELW